MPRRLGTTHQSQKGFTLVEVLGVIAIIGLVGAGIGTAVFQVMNISASSSNLITAIKRTESAAYWIVRDVQMSQAVEPSGGSGFPLNLSWVEWDNTTHQVSYTLENGKLWRSYSVNGAEPSLTLTAESISEDADKTSCQYADGMLSLRITASTGGFREASETRIAQVIPRSTP